MEIARKKIDEMEPAFYNPRVKLQPGDVMWENLKRSVDRYGLVVPIVWNKRTNRVVSGHQRLEMMKDRGEQEVDVSVVDMDEPKEKQLVIALNKIEGDWDEERLSSLLKELGDYAELTGLSQAEIDVLTKDIQDLTDIERVKQELEDNEQPYSLSLRFNVADKENIMFYIKEYGKEPLCNEILSIVRGEKRWE